MQWLASWQFAVPFRIHPYLSEFRIKMFVEWWKVNKNETRLNEHSSHSFGSDTHEEKGSKTKWRKKEWSEEEEEEEK